MNTFTFTWFMRLLCIMTPVWCVQIFAWTSGATGRKVVRLQGTGHPYEFAVQHLISKKWRKQSATPPKSTMMTESHPLWVKCKQAFCQIFDGWSYLLLKYCCFNPIAYCAVYRMLANILAHVSGAFWTCSRKECQSSLWPLGVRACCSVQSQTVFSASQKSSLFKINKSLNRQPIVE